MMITIIGVTADFILFGFLYSDCFLYSLSSLYVSRRVMSDTTC